MTSDHNIVRMMDLYGGSFVQALAALCAKADLQNFDRLKAAFPDVWQEYAAIYERVKARDAVQR